MRHPHVQDLVAGTVLGVWAHPDDEAYLSGGVMALARDAGARVVCVTATRGEHGTSDPQAWPPHRLAAERSRELVRCLAVLGVEEHHWLGHGDGECADVPEEAAVARLADLVAEVAPDTVLTFGPDGVTGHPDHQAVSRWTTAAFDLAAPAGARLLYAAVPERRVPRWGALDEQLGVYLPGYPVVHADDDLALDVALPEPTLGRKVRALRAQATQTAGLIATMGEDEYAAWVADESFVERQPARRPALTPA